MKDEGSLIETRKPRSTTTATVFPLSGLENAGKMDVQLDANVKDQDCAERGKNEAGGMESSGCRARKHVGYGAADD